MKPRALDPLHLDVAALAQQGASLAGSWPLASLRRLAESAHVEVPANAGDAVAWSARGERRARAGRAAETWLHLQAATSLQLQCQRCLGPVQTELQVERALRFVPGEDQAAALDAESEDDVLALSPSLDLRALVEDELLLALPLVPRHEICPQPLSVRREPLAPEGAQEGQHPFAVLRELKDTGGKD